MAIGKPAGLVLAGGLSTRMGHDKTQAMLAGIRMIDHVVSKLAPQVGTVRINVPAAYPAPEGIAFVPDALPGHQGPLAGILAGMRHAAGSGADVSHIVTVPADSPFIPQDLVARLVAALPSPQAIAVAGSSGNVHPVVALWPVELADDLATWLADPENRRVRAFIARHPNLSVAFPPFPLGDETIDPFFNVNTPEELAQAEGWMQKLGVQRPPV